MLDTGFQWSFIQVMIYLVQSCIINFVTVRGHSVNLGYTCIIIFLTISGYARDHEPCIIFMDEIDAIGRYMFVF